MHKNESEKYLNMYDIHQSFVCVVLWLLRVSCDYGSQRSIQVPRSQASTQITSP